MRSAPGLMKYCCMMQLTTKTEPRAQCVATRYPVSNVMLHCSKISITIGYGIQNARLRNENTNTQCKQ